MSQRGPIGLEHKLTTSYLCTQQSLELLIPSQSSRFETLEEPSETSNGAAVANCNWYYSSSGGSLTQKRTAVIPGHLAMRRPNILEAYSVGEEEVGTMRCALTWPRVASESCPDSPGGSRFLEAPRNEPKCGPLRERRPSVATHEVVQCCNLNFLLLAAIALRIELLTIIKDNIHFLPALSCRGLNSHLLTGKYHNGISIDQ